MSKKHRGHAKGDPVTYQTPLPAGGVRRWNLPALDAGAPGPGKAGHQPLDAAGIWTRLNGGVREMAQDTLWLRAPGLAPLAELAGRRAVLSMTDRWHCGTGPRLLCKMSQMIGATASTRSEAIALGHPDSKASRYAAAAGRRPGWRNVSGTATGLRRRVRAACATRCPGRFFVPAVSVAPGASEEANRMPRKPAPIHHDSGLGMPGRGQAENREKTAKCTPENDDSEVSQAKAVEETPTLAFEEKIPN